MPDLLGLVFDVIVPGTAIALLAGVGVYLVHFAFIPFSTRRGLETAREYFHGEVESLRDSVLDDGAGGGLLPAFDARVERILERIPSPEALLSKLPEIMVKGEDESGAVIEVSILDYLDSRIDALGQGLTQTFSTLATAKIDELKAQAVPLIREAVQAIASAAASGRATSNSKLGVQAREQNAAIRDLVKAGIVHGASQQHPLLGVGAGMVMDNVPELVDFVAKNPEAAEAMYAMLKGKSNSPPPSFSGGNGGVQNMKYDPATGTWK